MIDSGFETKSVRMQLLLLVSFQAPSADVDRIMDAVVAITPLGMGSNAFQSADGVERYRPLEGAAAGAETLLRQRPGTVEVSFELPDDQALAARVVEAIYQAHSYEEPVIRIQPLLASRSKGLDDRANPNRWWNTTGDWKKAAPPVREDA
ncbi:MAG: hypothetical protein E5V46_29710 [Mesorhizobium sp.]|nr:MAG: hypothetical protein E5V46_29710 [Mesorhizobium sp.]